MKIKQLREENVDYYDPIRWAKYNHEEPEQIIERMTRAIWDMADSLEPGATGILVSHGDPIAWAANYLLLGTIPEPKKLREKLYPTKGQALMLTVVPSTRTIRAHQLINNPQPGNIY